MKILLFGVSNVGKTTIGKVLAQKLNYDFYDIDEEIKKKYHVTLEEFVNEGTIEKRDERRGRILFKLVEDKSNKVIAVTPISYMKYMHKSLKKKDVFAIELKDTPENIFSRLVFSDENDEAFKNDQLKNMFKKYYLSEIRKDLEWYGKCNRVISNKFDINNDNQEDAANRIIEEFKLLGK